MYGGRWIIIAAYRARPLLAACLTLALGGCHTFETCCSGTAPVHEMPYLINGTPSPTASQHVIEVGDLLEIQFPFKPLVVDATEPRLQSPPAQTLTVIVRDDGMFSLPLIGSVQAAGLTPDQLRDEILKRYDAIKYDPAEGQLGVKTYLVMVNDTLEVRFRNQPDLDQKLTVGPDGKVSLFLVGSVAVEGLSLEQIDNLLTERYSKFIPTPDINVNLLDFSSTRVFVDGKPKQLGPIDVDEVVVQVRDYTRKVYVMGEVFAAQMISYKGPMTAAQAIAAAGGHKRSALLRHVVILRKQDPNGEPVALVADLRKALRGGPASDVALAHQDVVIVPKTPITKVTDVLEQYIYQVVPFTRNTPMFSFFYDLSRQSVPLQALTQ